MICEGNLGQKGKRKKTHTPSLSRKGWKKRIEEKDKGYVLRSWSVMNSWAAWIRRTSSTSLYRGNKS